MLSALRVRCQLARAVSFAFLALLAGASSAAAQTLMWNANPEPDLAGYIVQYGTQSGNPSSSVDVGNVTSRQFTGLTPGSTYYFRVVAYNTSSQQSTPSAQVSFTVPGVPSGPTVTGLSPTSGPTSGGTVITITGTSFAGTTTVRVGGAAATSVSVIGATQIRATTPAGTAGAQTVQVTTNGVTLNSPVAFTYAASGGPTITSVSPSSGPTGGGTTFTINGTGFVQGSGGEIRVGGVMTTGIAFISATQLRAVTPAGTAGARDVLVRNPNGQTATLTGGFTYTSSAVTPTLTAVSPASGPAAGGTTITLTGTNFASGATVRVGGTAATNVTFVSATQVTARTPAGTAGARDVQVTNPDGQSATRTGAFTYTSSSSTNPTITAVSPNSGPAAGGTTITITGSNYVLGSGGEIRVGGRMCTNIQYISATQLRAVTPSGTAGNADVYVRNPNGSTATLTGGFRYTSGATSSQTLTQAQPLAATETADVTADAARAAETAPGTFRRYLAEGVVNDQMSTRLALANPAAADAHAVLTFSTADGPAARLAVDVPARSRRTVDLATVPALAGQTFSTVMEADQNVALDRLTAWDARGLAASLASAVDQPSATWYFAEGSTTDPYELFYLVQNPGTTDAKVRVRYLLPGGAPVVKAYAVAAGGRATIWVDREDARLASTDVAAEITSVTGAPIVVERSLYLKDAASALPRGGDSSAGVTAPAQTWSAEGATGRFATTLLIANPGAEAARVETTYQAADGTRIITSHDVAANSRATVNVAREHPALADAVVDIAVESTAPVVVERTMSWGANGAAEETMSGGATANAGSRWLLAEGELGGARQAVTTLAIANQGAATDVTVTLLFEDGPEVSATFAAAAGARLAVPVEQAFPMAAGRRFSMLIEASDPAASLTVDRALFWRAEGAARTAGGDGAAVRLQ